MTSTQKVFFAISVAVATVTFVWFGTIFSSLPSTNAPATSDTIASFEECKNAGYLILESYPARCKTPDGKTFVEDIGNELEKYNLIRTSSPRPNETVKSPLGIAGEARGYWFFEASFPAELFDADGQIIGTGIMQAEGEWMTEEFVPYKGTIVFRVPAAKRGTLILKKDNPSGLPEHDDFLRIPVIFSE
ncbi:MAG: hypothetical protein A2131_01860 [Candidatus Sungbacteria bacterium GWC2_49_10]|uniref:Bacterial spore germination immunoglobulin-like domain-containing protein n=2 Tax=Parcubacteria group TaxID=1794811 RepID=A0A0G1WS44_9BACT|nr:MAG: hypothetical protein UY60_C0012G0014 [Parcubacteria group bacterium GW2011_GWB1_50_9]KKW21405.1 MAG: hypothetical protein UY61_C0007G0014 [Candidatus Adlerbacteria bacterium GW2011_GWC1_50_9]OGZ93053.1 MAG: hypothetical protein A2131_01860 [Candidatus Sungbacteria bacterium GWC2_49_10]